MEKVHIFHFLVNDTFKRAENMSYICSTGLGIPDEKYAQEKVKGLVKEMFPSLLEKKVNRIMPIFDHAQVEERQLVVTEGWLKQSHTFEEKNDLYQKHSLLKSLEAIDHCLTNPDYLQAPVPYEAIDLIIYISSTGIMTPSPDTYIMNERPFREDVVRMPLWGLGCAGGAIGLGRAFDWLVAHPNKTALIVCCELCSLTFQKTDTKMSNIVGTALFGDGVGAALLMGDTSPSLSLRKKPVPKIMKTSSFTKKDSTKIMGWDIKNAGFEVVFSKKIPKLVQTIWKDHLLSFFKELNLTEAQIHSFIAHPGGRKVLEAMEDTLSISQEKMKHSYHVLAHHGNMSSATVIYVLHEWLKESIAPQEKSILSALGPGFSSELLLLEWVE